MWANALLFFFYPESAKGLKLSADWVWRVYGSSQDQGMAYSKPPRPVCKYSMWLSYWKYISCAEHDGIHAPAYAFYTFSLVFLQLVHLRQKFFTAGDPSWYIPRASNSVQHLC